MASLFIGVQDDSSHDLLAHITLYTLVLDTHIHLYSIGSHLAVTVKPSGTVPTPQEYYYELII